MLLLGALPSYAYELGENDSSATTPQVTSGRSSVGVVLVDGRWVSGSGGGGSSERDCEMTVTRIPVLEEIHIATDVIEGAIPVRVTCNPNGVDGDFWVPDADVSARAEAQRYAEEVLAPGLALEVNPPDNILVGLPTWFWLDGWDGSPITTTVTAPWGDAVDLELTLERVDWTFGDGSPAESGDLGVAYPEESTIQHVYTHRSTSPAEPDGGYEVAAELRLGVRYWYDGGGPYTVDPISVTTSDDIVVRQLQAVLSRS